MSSIAPSELILLFAVALLVLGPKRFPKVARQVGLWVGRARLVANQLHQQLEREIALNEIAKAEKRGTKQRQALPQDEEAEPVRVPSHYDADLYPTGHEEFAAGKRPPESVDEPPSR